MNGGLMIERIEDLHVVESEFGAVRWVEYKNQRWVARRDVGKAVGYSTTLPFAIAKQITPSNMMTADRLWRAHNDGKISFFNEAGLREFGQLPLGRIRLRQKQPLVIEWLLSTVYGRSAKKTPKPIEQSLFMLSEAEMNQIADLVAERLFTMFARQGKAVKT